MESATPRCRAQRLHPLQDVETDQRAIDKRLQARYDFRDTGLNPIKSINSSYQGWTSQHYADSSRGPCAQTWYPAVPYNLLDGTIDDGDMLIRPRDHSTDLILGRGCFSLSKTRIGKVMASYWSHSPSLSHIIGHHMRSSSRCASGSCGENQ